MKSHENVCKNQDYCYIEMSKNNTLIYKYGGKSMKVPFFIYTDTEPLLEKIDISHNNLQKL